LPKLALNTGLEQVDVGLNRHPRAHLERIEAEGRLARALFAHGEDAQVGGGREQPGEVAILAFGWLQDQERDWRAPSLELLQEVKDGVGLAAPRDPHHEHVAVQLIGRHAVGVACRPAPVLDLAQLQPLNARRHVVR